MVCMAGHDHAHGTHVYTGRDAVKAVVISADLISHGLHLGWSCFSRAAAPAALVGLVRAISTRRRALPSSPGQDRDVEL